MGHAATGRGAVRVYVQMAAISKPKRPQPDESRMPVTRTPQRSLAWQITRVMQGRRAEAGREFQARGADGDHGNAQRTSCSSRRR